jgi:hypothetical protein
MSPTFLSGSNDTGFAQSRITQRRLIIAVLVLHESSIVFFIEKKSDLQFQAGTIQAVKQSPTVLMSISCRIPNIKISNLFFRMGQGSHLA